MCAFGFIRSFPPCLKAGERMLQAAVVPPLPAKLRSGWDAVRAATRIVKREWKAAGLPVHTPTPKTVRKDYSHKSMSAIEARRGRNK